MPEAKKCPSAQCASGNWLFGLIRSDGKVGRLTPPMKIDDGFVDAVSQGTDPLRRFRFAGDCVEDQCQHWIDKKCMIAEKLVATFSKDDVLSNDTQIREKCTFRSRCRWFSQEGWPACDACPHVVTSG